MVSFQRTHTCGALRESDVHKKVILTGWVHRHRNLGSVLFIDLRDRFGITQLVIDTKIMPEGKNLRFEDVIVIEGKVLRRQSPNKELSTGAIEVQVMKLEVLSAANVLPFSICDETLDVNEEVRLEYRYLDMRRGPILDNLILRHKAMMAIRQFMDSAGFTEVSTPMLAKSTPEGSRDYLVPSRIYPGMFYALPQSPQLFKQLLMVGGLDRYFQIATCLRDEDLRADRQPEFAQIDIEMSFATADDLFPIIEKLVQSLFSACIGVELKLPFRRMTHAECMEHYGCDKPDLRFGMPLKRLDQLAQDTTFAIFHDILKAQGIVKGFVLKGGAEMSRKEIDELTTFVQALGVKGLVWIKRQESGCTSSILKFIPQDELSKWYKTLELEVGDIAFVVAGNEKKVNQALDHLRRKVAKEHGLVKKDRYEFLWVTDFPLFNYNDEEERIESEHHPFTSPNFDDIDLIRSNPLKVRSSSYDLVLNGYEVASGSQRIHDGKLQELIFETLGLTKEERKQKFGFFIEALQFGTPPHIGIALGLDRFMMILCQTESIRDVVAFPKTAKAQDLMMKAPSAVADQQLKELKIRINKE